MDGTITTVPLQYSTTAIATVFHVGEEDGDHVYAPTAYTADDSANQSSRANLQTGAILHLPRGRRDRNPGYVR